MRVYFLVFVAFARQTSVASAKGSRCGNVGECCSWEQTPPPPPGVPSYCCGSSMAGEERVTCADQEGVIERERVDRVGWCFRGRTHCYSGHDRPECNLPASTYAPSFESCKREDVVGDDVYGGPKLHTAVVVGDLARVRRLAAQTGAVNSRGNGGATPLHMAGMSRAGQSTVGILVGLGADLEAVDEFGYLPLHRFAHNDLVRGAAAMLEAGANVNGRGRGGTAALHLACMINSPRMAALLLSYGADAGATDAHGRTPFQLGLWSVRESVHDMATELARRRRAVQHTLLGGGASATVEIEASQNATSAPCESSCAPPGTMSSGVL